MFQTLSFTILFIAKKNLLAAGIYLLNDDHKKKKDQSEDSPHIKFAGTGHSAKLMAMPK